MRVGDQEILENDPTTIDHHGARESAALRRGCALNQWSSPRAVILESDRITADAAIRNRKRASPDAAALEVDDVASLKGRAIDLGEGPPGSALRSSRIGV